MPASQCLGPCDVLSQTHAAVRVTLAIKSAAQAGWQQAESAPHRRRHCNDAAFVCLDLGNTLLRCPARVCGRPWDVARHHSSRCGTIGG